ncbi:MarR family winged helix-turn-helix transcriptional regulator [Campylobacter canadensis]|uniref:HTH-type transcriptional regulator SarZ n=1 Tax=Campylobacter canadensis TaxID=449520 RepID=A0ABS7WSZ8_9BACT|nr:MarR family winged helix-turn-helix transcriptional regulator [Campylobacter canadensis]MBZ7987899.1 winged helix-turn-helix transcriptional regulator [Campylobacter canadensis]MBZ7998357.1 winged helix-turn-helix transcriptional regulator [Campylobacter canadensis]
MFYQKIAYADRKIIQKINSISSEYNLNFSDLRVFSYLSKTKDCNISSICAYYDLDRALLSRTINKLKQMKLIHISKNEDKREKIISLSTKAKEIYFDINIKLQAFDETLLSPLNSDEKYMLFNLLDKINKNL